jgi:tRNA (guanosine-2'-O-)-methyltransferase
LDGQGRPERFTLTSGVLRWHVEIVMDAGFPLEPFLLPSRARRLEEAVARRTRSLAVVLDGVHDPHNLSAVVRSCESFGLLDLHVVESHARFRLSSKVSQGAEKWLDIHLHPEPGACIQALSQGGFHLWVADPAGGSVQVDQLPFEDRIALVFGSEHDGISAEMARASSGRFRIPMYGFSRCFNVSVAAGIALATAVEKREQRCQGHGDLTQSEQKALLADWQHRSVKHADRILFRLRGQSEVKGRET